MRKICIASLCCLPLFLGAIGCGPSMPDTVPVTGTVTLDGEPVEGAGVQFIADSGAAASGETDASGKFSLKTFVGAQGVDGAPVGSYKVGINKTKSDSVAPPAEYDPTNPMVMNTANVNFEYIVPQKYNAPMGSGLTANVVEGTENNFTFELSSK